MDASFRSELFERLAAFLGHGARILEIVPDGVDGAVAREAFAALEPRWTAIGNRPGPGIECLLDGARVTEVFARGSFDAVVALDALGGRGDWRRAAIEALRALAPGGVMLLGEGGATSLWRFGLENLEAVAGAAGELLASVREGGDQGLDTACAVVLRKSASWEDKAFGGALESVHPLPAPGVKQEELEFEGAVLFDQHSRLHVCGEILAKVARPGDSVLDVGCGPECLLGGYLPDLRVTYLDPLIARNEFRSVNQIAGGIDSPEVQGRTFDHVTAIDVIEHVPVGKREEFLRRVSSLAGETLVLLFPSSDGTRAREVDDAVNALFREIFGHEYPWLDEHISHGLPSCSWVEETLGNLGWHCSKRHHGNADMLAWLLPVILVLWETPRTRPAALRISQKFVASMGDLDHCPPFYRTCLVASRGAARDLTSAFHPSCGFFEERWRDFRDFVEAELAGLHQWQAEAAAGRLRPGGPGAVDAGRAYPKDLQAISGFEQLSQKYEACQAELANTRRELMDMSEWASWMKRRLDVVDSIPQLNRLLTAYSLLRQGPRQFARGVAMKLRSTGLAQTFLRAARRKAASELFESVKATGRVVVVFPIIPWSLRWQRPQQLLTRVAERGHTVVYLSMNLAPRGEEYADEAQAREEVSFTKLHPGVFEVSLRSRTHCVLYENCLKDGNLRNVLMGLSATLEELNVREPVLLVQFPSWHSLAKPLRDRFGGSLVFDCMDDHSGFENTKPDALQAEEDLLREADLVLASSDLLFDKAKVLNENVLLVNNGTEFEHFHDPRRNGELDRLADRPVIGYFGAIAEWFDVELLAHCAKARPQWNFVLIGCHTHCDVSALERLGNVHLLGEKKYAELPGYLAYFTVCTIPFQLTPLILATNPVKFYEYLSAAKPVVSVNLPELQPFRDICYLAKDKEDFLAKLDAAVAEKPDKALTDKRLAVARSNSWDNRVETILASKAFAKR